MKDVLILGGAGKIGFDLVLKLLDTNSNITVLDMESRESTKKMQSVKDRIRVVYGDVEDADLVRDLVKRNDVVIDYAGIMPPLANLNEGIAHTTNFIGTKNVVDAIVALNPECVYIYMSFICVYGMSSNKVRKLSIDTESTYPDDYYSVSVIRSEDYIKSHLEKYTILRMPIVLTKSNYFIKHMCFDRMYDFITKEDLNDVVLKVIKVPSKTLGKTFNVSGFKSTGRRVVEGLYKSTGKLNILKRNLYYGEYEDLGRMDKVISMKYTGLDQFLQDLYYEVPVYKRQIRKIGNFIKYQIFKRMK